MSKNTAPSKNEISKEVSTQTEEVNLSPTSTSSIDAELGEHVSELYETAESEGNADEPNPVPFGELKTRKSQFQKPLETVEEASSGDEARVNFGKDVTIKVVKSDESSDSDESEEEELATVLKSSKSQFKNKARQYKFSSSDSNDSDIGKHRREDFRKPVGGNLDKGNAFVYIILPPDGGYGWFVMIISFLCQVVVDGIVLAVGIILPHIAKEFEVAGSQVILLASMQVGCYFLAGTVSSAFINKYGFRPVAMSGCLISITVLTVATFSPNLTFMIIFYSIMGGPGLSMIWVSSQLIIGYYFERYRPIANGVACSGAGVGLMVFAFMNSTLVDRLGWRNLLRVHVGFLLMVGVMVLAYVEVKPTRIGRVKESNLDESDSSSMEVLTNLKRYSTIQPALADDYEEALGNMWDNYDSIPQIKKNWFYYHMCRCCFGAEEKTDGTKHFLIKRDLIERQDLFYMGPKEKPPAKDMQQNASRISRRSTKIERTISLDSNIESNMLIHRISMNMEEMNAGRKSDRRKTYSQLKESECCPVLSYLHPKNLLHPKIVAALSKLFDFNLLSSGEFRILLLSAFMFPMGFNIPFVYSTVRVQIEPAYAKLISPTIGFSNFLFRILSGLIAYKYRDYTTFICGGGMVFGGLAVLISAFYGLDVVWFQFTYAMCYGIAPAFYSTLRAIIYVRTLGLDKLTNAFGLTALAMGLGVFLGTTTGGILNEYTGNYSASFVFAGTCIIFSGTLKLVLPFL